MKQLMFILVCLMMACNGQYNDLESTKAMYYSEYSIAEFNVNGGHTLAIMGDSRMWAFRAQDYYTNHIVNVGHSGITAEGVLERAPQIVSYNPEIILISIGINNYFKNCETRIMYDIERTIDYLQATTSATIYITSIVPVSSVHPFASDWNTRIVVKNPEVQALCVSKGVTFIDLAELCVGNSLNNLYTNDTIHYSKDGYNKLSEILHRFF